jgi:transcription elongation factor GreA
MSKQYLSKERLEEFKKELDELKSNRRNDVAQRLKQAKEYGDLSENSEYAEAREEQANVETRIFELEDIIKDAVVIEKSGDNGAIEVGSVITIKKGEKTSIYTIVGKYEAKPEEGKISDESPLGKAFLGHKVGDKITVTTPGGVVVYAIVKID